jgi:hypothetical protein
MSQGGGEEAIAFTSFLSFVPSVETGPPALRKSYPSGGPIFHDIKHGRR